jgi:hypothetical protein
MDYAINRLESSLKNNEGFITVNLKQPNFNAEKAYNDLRTKYPVETAIEE